MARADKVTIIGEKIDYTSPPMDIIKYEIAASDGKKRPYWVLDRKSDFAIIIPIFKDLTTVLVGQYRVPIRQLSWEFSMGTVLGKSPQEIAEQELREETGIIAKKWTKIGDFYLAPGISPQVGHVFIAEDLTSGDPMPEEGEDLITQRLALLDVGKKIKEHEIKDGPTIIAWQIYQNYKI